ncbi:hypothetical protein ES319_A11G004900v1 [Gossypium barbadense]|uniref:Uncharacterized protein n=1 Tax=Gossypium barbadense TaxID=3634 RepID=A0A5J5TGD4_GOSBA|nr:hypothetical protein ES319_A11G004900v1 [Gossypium barbadense]
MKAGSRRIEERKEEQMKAGSRRIEERKEEQMKGWEHLKGKCLIMMFIMSLEDFRAYCFCFCWIGPRLFGFCYFSVLGLLHWGFVFSILLSLFCLCFGHMFGFLQ